MAEFEPPPIATTRPAIFLVVLSGTRARGGGGAAGKWVLLGVCGEAGCALEREKMFRGAAKKKAG